jgi:hypothetical protein
MTPQEYFRVWQEENQEPIKGALNRRSRFSPEQPLDSNLLRTFLLLAYKEGWKDALSDHLES